MNDLDHIVCGECDPEVYLCGTPRRRDEEKIVHMGHPHEGQPCAVCFVAVKSSCNSCGAHIGGIITDLEPVPARRPDDSWLQRLEAAHRKQRRPLLRRMLDRVKGVLR